MKRYKVGETVEFYCLGSPTTGLIKRINKEEKSLYIESNGLMYPNVVCIENFPKKGQKPPWYILE